MPTGEARYAARFPTPEMLERGRGNQIRLQLELDGEAITPSACTVSVFDENGNAIVNGASATPGTTTTYNILGGALPVTLQTSAGWLIEWAATIDGTVHTFRRECYLCKRLLYPMIGQADLLKLHADLSTMRGSGRNSYANEIDEADIEITNRLIEDGNRPNLIISPSALRMAYLFLAASNVFRGMAPSLGPNNTYAELAKQYRDMYDAAYRAVKLQYDSDEDGVIDNENVRQSTQGHLHLFNPGSRSRPGRSWA